MDILTSMAESIAAQLKERGHTIAVSESAAGGLISIIGLLLVFPDDRSARWLVAPLVGTAVVPMYAAITDNDAIGDWMWNNAIYVAGAIVLAGVVLQTSRAMTSREMGSSVAV